MLDDDWYKIYRNMTHFAYVDKQNIEDYLLKNKIETKDSLKKLNSYFDNIEWNKAKKNLEISINKDNYGIPQGSPISCIFANIYMINFDKSLSDYIKEKTNSYLFENKKIYLLKDKTNKILSSINYLGFSFDGR